MKIIYKKNYIFTVILLFILLIFTFIYFFDQHSDGSKCALKITSSNSIPTIYIITPTYARYVQKAELIRFSHTLLLVPNVLWILVEDSEVKTELVTKFLNQIQTYGQLKYTHLNVPTPIEYKTKTNDPNWIKPRGVLQRNIALRWLREHQAELDKEGIVYFADDDNTYDLRLFNEMRNTTKVSVWPVGLVGGLLVEKPIVEDGIVTGWNSLWKPNRKFPIDMAGFAIKLRFLLENKDALFSLKVPRGFQETHLLKQIINDISDLEPKANDCNDILVWHTRTEEPKLRQEKKLKIPSNFNMEL